MFENKLERVQVSSLKINPRNARTHSKLQLEQIAASIKRFGFLNPVLIDDDLMIIAGHGRVEAAKQLAIEEIPALKLSHLSDAEKRAYLIADNRLAEKAGWDREVLAVELQALVDLNFEMEVIGFEVAEIDHILENAGEANADARDEPEDALPSTPLAAVSRLGDVWQLGRHRLACADARDSSAYKTLMAGTLADAVFTDPPYNVPIDGFVGGGGKVKHESFAMACGEMTEEEFEEFLSASLKPAAEHMRDGSIAFVCIDWRHMKELLNAGGRVFDELKNVCVWTKTNGGMGSLYRSQHELVFVYKRGSGPHLNNVELGRFGRNRTNVWAYAGVNTFKAERDTELAMHPTVKPVALIHDALKDVTKRGEIVLDPFGGSGSTLIAAEKCGRSARLIEIDPLYCDVIIKRFQVFTGKDATLEGSDKTFEEMRSLRGAESAGAQGGAD